MRYPGWAQLLKRTRVDGTPHADGTFGPYLQSAVVNHLNGSSVVMVVESTFTSPVSRSGSGCC